MSGLVARVAPGIDEWCGEDCCTKAQVDPELAWEAHPDCSVCRVLRRCVCISVPAGVAP
jgi:hypothetical protein